MMPLSNRKRIHIAVVALLLQVCSVANVSAFVEPSRTRLPPASTHLHHKHDQSCQQMQAIANGEGAPMQVTDDNSRAGKDGYSLLRQPLMKESWDPTQDPTFDAPSTLEDQDVQQQNIDWWSNKKQSQKQTSKSTSYTTSAPLPVDDSDGDEELDLFQRSLDTLDFPFVLNALRNECFTMPGKQKVEAAMRANPVSMSASLDGPQSERSRRSNRDKAAFQPLTSNSTEGVQSRFEAVKEMQWILLSDFDSTPDVLRDAYYKNRKGYQVTLGNGNPPPLDGLNFDLESILQLAAEGQILEGPELLDISVMMNAMEDLQLWSRGLQRIDDPEIKFEAVPALASEIELNTTLQILLEDAFDKEGKLSGKTFPLLGQLRAKIRTLKGDILQTLDDLVSLPSIQSKLALESGGPLYSEISNGGGRLVLPMDPRYASQIGIVHDSSRSGKTVYVEPSEVVGPTNELRQTESELKAEEARVWRSLTEQVWNNRHDLEQSVQAVGQLDLVLARCLLGQSWNGVIPDVQDEGVVSLKDAKHPVLLLRGIPNVVGSDLDLGADGNQGLVLTGPNSGGKTVILKLLGLLALMSRSGIPIPAQPSQPGDSARPRVDLFNPVLADIGDIQSVGGDLSTFSGHMLVCREVLANSGRNSLVLMDELGSGTDPAQGVAIAQALLEALMETGCRVAITTHYMALKQLAASDARFSVGGMQFVNGRPTYKLLPGTVGESFALAVAERLELPTTVLERANELLDSETRQMGDLIRELEDQKAVIDNQVAELEQKKEEMKALEFQMKEEQHKLEKRMLTARRDEAKKFAQKLEEKEQILEDVLEKLKSDPSRKLLAKSWDDIKFVKRDALNEAENVPSMLKAKRKAAIKAADAKAELVPLAELREKPDIKPGDTLIVCKSGPLFGREAVVVKNLGKQFQVQVSGMTVAMKMTELSAVTKGIIPSQPSISSTQSKKNKLSKAAQKALKSDVDGGLGGATAPELKPKGTVSIRTASNTIDVRGYTFEEAKSMVKDQISKAIVGGQTSVYVLHGHGTGGVLKSKIRGWLKTERQLVKRHSPADQSDGGDAFTKIEVR